MHMERKGKTKNNYKILVGKPAGRGPLKDHLLDLNVNLDQSHRLELYSCGYGQVEGFCEHGNETWPS